jgi:hypothetical protein
MNDNTKKLLKINFICKCGKSNKLKYISATRPHKKDLFSTFMFLYSCDCGYKHKFVNLEGWTGNEQFDKEIKEEINQYFRDEIRKKA